MTDKRRTILAVGLFLAALILPVGVAMLALGMSVFNALDSQARIIMLILGGALFIIPMTVSIISFLKIKNLSWIAAGFPFIASLLYSGSVVDVIPDMVPFVTRLDDGAVVTLGAILTFILTHRRNPQAPKWIFVPLVIAAVYTFLGGIIPGGLDELIVQVLALLSFLYGANKGLPVQGEQDRKIPEE